MKKYIPTIRERERNEKKPIPIIREREGNEKKHSQNSGTGIRGFHSWEWTGTGIPAHPNNNKQPAGPDQVRSGCIQPKVLPAAGVSRKYVFQPSGQLLDHF